MFTVAFFGLVVVLHLAFATEQNPPVTPCPGKNKTVVQIQSIVVTGAKLGKKMKLDGTILITQVVGQNPVLQISVSKPNGTKLPCVPSVLPCTLHLCNGTTRQEKQLNKDWGNTCPVQPGTYTAQLTISLAKGQEAEEYFGDGNVIVKFNIVDGSKVLGCASIPIAIDVN